MNKIYFSLQPEIREDNQSTEKDMTQAVSHPTVRTPRSVRINPFQPAVYTPVTPNLSLKQMALPRRDLAYPLDQ